MYSRVRGTVGTGWSEGCRDVLTCQRNVEMYSRVRGTVGTGWSEGCRDVLTCQGDCWDWVVRGM